MTSKRMKMIGLAITFSVTLFFFIKYLVVVLAYFKHPLDFSFMPVFVAIILLFLMLFHLAGYVMIMDEKTKVRKIEDVEEWWTKWDRV